MFWERISSHDVRCAASFCHHLDDSSTLFLYAGIFEKGTTALQYGDTARRTVEPLDIANYYRRKLWIKSDHYLVGENRPRCWPFFEAAHEKAYPGQALESMVPLAEKEQAAVEEAKTKLDDLQKAVADMAASSSGRNFDMASILSAANAVHKAVQACELPKTKEAAWKLVKLAAREGASMADIQAAEEQLRDQFWHQSCENNL